MSTARGGFKVVPMNAVRSGDALMTFGTRDLLVRSWNAEAERLTGIPAADAVGRPCWDVLRAADPSGALVCHPGCSGARMAREGRPAATRELQVERPDGRLRLSVSTLVANGDGGEPLGMHLLRPLPDGAGERRAPEPDEIGLSPRQREVLRLLAEGVNAKGIARRLRISELTARNHIRAVRTGLGCHSQLEAVAEARRRRIV
jgi:DNA-binding CsgD family transcriptional regulator